MLTGARIMAIVPTTDIARAKTFYGRTLGFADANTKTESDNGGVHINSGIPSRAFVLAAKAIGGYSWEKTGKIWYITLTERLTGNSDFAKCAAETVSVARVLYPERSRQSQRKSRRPGLMLAC